LSSVRSEIARRSRVFSASRSFRRFTYSLFNPPNSWGHRHPAADGVPPPGLVIRLCRERTHRSAQVPASSTSSTSSHMNA
jgi:hypothetical protein